ncbi:hypothetical protein Agub_g15252 [Astrephomene gubernaculifera]|uniref:Uncharacterized protein n=1 Tax=Astrephomene gubernaculifera TaxID=47775 RepID=A0AAD3E526_9CHLO|nr:hypothetical protein Agub_g15252 [Astrephomene gubernaculifera]
MKPKHSFAVLSGQMAAAVMNLGMHHNPNESGTAICYSGRRCSTQLSAAASTKGQETCNEARATAKPRASGSSRAGLSSNRCIRCACIRPSPILLIRGIHIQVLHFMRGCFVSSHAVGA